MDYYSEVWMECFIYITWMDNFRKRSRRIQLIILATLEKIAIVISQALKEYNLQHRG